MEFCAACENGNNAHVAWSQCERARISRLAEGIWTFDQLEKEVPVRTWDEMFFGEGGGVIGINWSVNEDLVEKRRKG